MSSDGPRNYSAEGRELVKRRLVCGAFWPRHAAAVRVSLEDDVLFSYTMVNLPSRQLDPDKDSSLVRQQPPGTLHSQPRCV